MFTLVCGIGMQEFKDRNKFPIWVHALTRQNDVDDHTPVGDMPKV